MFRQEFKDNIKNELTQNERNYKNFIEFIEIAINLNDKLYE